jgi:hypothetical protein
MAKEIPAFLRAEIGNNATDPTQETRDSVCSSTPAAPRLDLTAL